MELEVLLNKGLSEYYEDNYQSLNLQQRKEIRTEIMHMNVCEVTSLALVMDFANKHEISKSKYDEVNNPYFIRKFCFDYIVGNAPFDNYKDKQSYYSGDHSVLQSIEAFNLDTKQIWFLLMFCIYYVDYKTRNIVYKSLSIRKQLKSIVDEVAKMIFSGDNWILDYPKHVGTLTLKVEGRSEIEINDVRTIHLLSSLIQHFLKEDHDVETTEALNKRNNVFSRKMIEFAYINRTRRKMKIPFKKINDAKYIASKAPNYYKIITADTYNTHEDMTLKRVALFKFYVIEYFNENNYNKQYEYTINSYTKSPYFIISKLLSILDYWGIKRTNKENEYQKNKDVKKQIDKKKEERKKRLYEDIRYLRGTLGEYDINEEKDEKEYLKSLFNL